MQSASRKARRSTPVPVPRSLARILILLAPNMDPFIVPLNRVDTYKNLLTMLNCLFGHDFCSETRPPILKLHPPGKPITPQNWRYTLKDDISIIVERYPILSIPKSSDPLEFLENEPLHIKRVTARLSVLKVQHAINIQGTDTDEEFDSNANSMLPTPAQSRIDLPETNTNTSSSTISEEPPKVKKRALWSSVVSVFSHNGPKDDETVALEHKFAKARESQRHTPKKRKEKRRVEGGTWSNRADFDKQLIEQMGLIKPPSSNKLGKQPIPQHNSRIDKLQVHIKPSLDTSSTEVTNARTSVLRLTTENLNTQSDATNPIEWVHPTTRNSMSRPHTRDWSMDQLSVRALPSPANSTIDLEQFPEVPDWNIRMLRGSVLDTPSMSFTPPSIPPRSSSSSFVLTPPATPISPPPMPETFPKIPAFHAKFNGTEQTPLKSSVEGMITMRVRESLDIPSGRKLHTQRSTSNINAVQSTKHHNERPLAFRRPSTSGTDSAHQRPRRRTDPADLSIHEQNRPGTAYSGRSRSNSTFTDVHQPASIHETKPPQPPRIPKLSPFPATRTSFPASTDPLLNAAIKKQIVPPAATFEDLVKNPNNFSYLDFEPGSSGNATATSTANKRKSLKDVVSLRKVSSNIEYALACAKMPHTRVLSSEMVR